MAKILVVDDLVANRALLRQALVALDNYEVVEAVSGSQAIELFEKEKPDLILMDIMMPDTDGREATTIIKEKMGEDYVPIIFVTALSSEDSLSSALESGGDDFISKPFNIEVLASKINAHLRIRVLNQQLNSKNKILLRLNQHLMNEQELIEHFFENAIKQSFLDQDFIKYHMSSMSAFNGDILLAEHAPRGGIYMILGDFSGHGLTAAMGTLPVAMIFFKMVKLNASVGEIAREINLQLHNLMPVSMFFAATILELNARGDIMSFWMGGNPDAYWLNKDGELKNIIGASHMPLGILSDAEFDDSARVETIEEGDKLYLYSDGIIEAKNTEGELFGEERLKNILVSNDGNRFEQVVDQLKDFTGESQDDDITLVELSCRAIDPAVLPEQKEIDVSALNWKLDISLDVNDMRTPNPVAKIMTILNAMPYLSRHKGVLHILLTEIYTNSLDHGILNIESVNKSDEQHFLEYYKKKDAALSVLESGFINFSLSFYKDEQDSYYLKIQTSDSGQGYTRKATAGTDEMLHGRGLSIIQSFCEKVGVSADGKTLEVLYQL